jgi:hypothetical protein
VRPLLSALLAAIFLAGCSGESASVPPASDRVECIDGDRRIGAVVPELGEAVEGAGEDDVGGTTIDIEAKSDGSVLVACD